MQPVINIITGTTAFTTRHPGREAVASIVQSWLNRAGVKASLNVTENNGPDFLTINGLTCRFPATLKQEVEIALVETPGKEEKFWQYFIEQILWLQPQIFYTESLGAEVFAPVENFGDPGIAESTTLELLQLKIALPDKTQVLDFFKPNGDKNLLEEQLIDAGSGKEIYVHINQTYFEMLVSLAGSSNLFELMRDGLFYETGITYPPFKIKFELTVALRSFYFEINTFTCLPFTGLEDNTILVNDTPEKLGLLKIEATDTVNPANGYAASFAGFNDKQTLEEAGLTTWDGFGYFILCFSSFLRRNGYLCVTKKLVTQYVEKLKTYYPALADIAMQQDQIPLITKTLRRLAKEQVTIRNLKFILEAIADFDWIKADDERIIFDERVTQDVTVLPVINHKKNIMLVTEFVRAKMKRYISHYHTKGQSTLVVYLLDLEIERSIKQAADSGAELAENEKNRILTATSNELKYSAVSTQTQVVLTTQTVRPHFKALVEVVYPAIVVLSYQELTADMSIQPVARISLG